MMLCNTCSNLTFEGLCRNACIFHESLKALVQSAESGGCALCGLFWAQIRVDYMTDTIDLCLEARLSSDVDGENEQDESFDARVIDFTVYLAGYMTPRNLPPEGGMNAALRLSCGKTIITGYKLMVELPVFADPGTPAAELISGRYITTKRNSDITSVVEVAQNWLEYCRKNHRACNTITGASNAKDPGGINQSRIPTRLIDVGSEKNLPRLVLTQQLLEPQQPYVALSYCWGEGVRHAVQLLDHNIADLCERLPMSELTKSHQEAIQLTRGLGIRYLWIDSLCIVQGNQADWEFESKRMGTIFGNAYLTIIAGRAADSRNGFLSNNFPLHVDLSWRAATDPVALKCGRLPLTKDGVDRGDLHVAIPRSATRGPIDGRSWCYQEYVLSTRSICFGAEQIIYSCRTGMQREDGDESTLDQTSPERIVGSSDDSRAAGFRRWYMMLYHFTPRALTEPHDIFASITSIAQIALKVVQCRYLAGLWEGDMPRGLMWKARHQQYLPLETALTRPKTSGYKGEVKGVPVIRAPSWSWASVAGPVVFEAGEHSEPLYCEPQNVFIRPRHQDNWWTATQEECGEPDRLFMPALELQLYGRLLAVQSSNRESYTARAEIEGYINSLPTEYRRWRMKLIKFGVLLRALSKEDSVSRIDSARKHPKQGNISRKPNADSYHRTNDDTGILGGGFFDFPYEDRPKNLWCLRVIVREGLLVTRDPTDNKFRRVGFFFLGVAGLKRFEGLDEVAVDLV